MCKGQKCKIVILFLFGYGKKGVGVILGEIEFVYFCVFEKCFFV